VDLLKRRFKEVGKDHLSAFAGALTYSGFLSIFPFSIFLLSLLGLFGAPNLLIDGIDRASAALPATEATFLRDQLLSIAQSRAQGAFTVGAVIAILLALWGISGAFRTAMDAMNVMYEVEEGRPFWKLYPISIFLSVGVAVLLIVALGLVTFGPQVARTIAADSGSLGTAFVWVWYVVQWPVLFCLVLLAFALVYYFAPDVEQRFRYVSPGSVIAALLWVGFSLLFSLYVNNFGSYNASYGALAGVVVLLLYIYYSSFILLVGAELNQVIEERSPEGKDKGEKTLDKGRG
jgi:membrane protein